MLSSLYGEIARRRRRWYARHPETVRRLARPVISVGNLTVGGTGKTPFVEYLCRWLVARGEQPAILTRGYGRQVTGDGVVIVRGKGDVSASLASAGDEPLMLARMLEGTRVLVSADRYLAGRLAELQLGATIHVLDDGFQHLQLRRDIDLLLVDPLDLQDPRTMPGGRLREPLECAADAHALITFAQSDADAARVAERLHIGRWFRAERVPAEMRLIAPQSGVLPELPQARVLAVAGIARPERFFADLTARGWTIARTVVFRDHHSYSAGDLERIERDAMELKADAIATTDKDLVRLERYLPLRVPVAVLPLSIRVEPEAPFRSWLLDRLEVARLSGPADLPSSRRPAESLSPPS